MANDLKDVTAEITMARNIRPLGPEDLPELSRFLSMGFHSRPDADFCHPEVLRWKYLEPGGFGSNSQKGDDQATGASPQEQPKSKPTWPLSAQLCRSERGQANCRPSRALPDALSG